MYTLNTTKPPYAPILIEDFPTWYEECHDLKDLDVTNKTTKQLSLIYWCHIWKCNTYKSTSNAFKSDKHDDKVLNNVVLQWQMSKTHSRTKHKWQVDDSMWQEQGAKRQGPFGNIIYMKIQQSWKKMARKKNN